MDQRLVLKGFHRGRDETLPPQDGRHRLEMLASLRAIPVRIQVGEDGGTQDLDPYTPGISDSSSTSSAVLARGGLPKDMGPRGDDHLPFERGYGRVEPDRESQKGRRSDTDTDTDIDTDTDMAQAGKSRRPSSRGPGDARGRTIGSSRGYESGGIVLRLADLGLDNETLHGVGHDYGGLFVRASTTLLTVKSSRSARISRVEAFHLSRVKVVVAIVSA